MIKRKCKYGGHRGTCSLQFGESTCGERIGRGEWLEAED